MRPEYDTRGPVRWVLAAALALALLTLAWFVLTARGNGRGSPPPSTTATPSQGEGKQAPPSQQPSAPTGGDCGGGNALASPGGKQRNLVHTGVAVTYPDGWRFRIDADQFGWMNDIHAWGKLEDQRLASVSVGTQANGLPQDGRQSVQRTWKCLVTTGFLKESRLSPEAQSDPTQINSRGLNGHELRVDEKASDGERVHVVIRSYPSQGKRVLVIGYTNHDPLSPGEQGMQKVLDSIGPA